MVWLGYVLWTSIDLIEANDFMLEKAKSRWYPEKTITGVDYADNLTLLTNTPAQAKSLLHGLKQAAGGIGPHVNANKTEYMCFKWGASPLWMTGISN